MTYSSSLELNKIFILFNSAYVPNSVSPSVSVSVFLCFEYKKNHPEADGSFCCLV